MKKICLLVHTGDHSKYLWPIWHRYWKENFLPFCKEKIDTVFLSETHADIRLEKCIREYTGQGMPWANGLMNYLSRSEYEYTIYHHEDYFITEGIDTSTILDIVGLMDEENIPLVKCCGWWGGYMDEKAPYIDEGKQTKEGRKLWRYNNNSMYLVSHQSSIWNTKFLLSTLYPNMTPWQHELEGTHLLRQRNPTIYAYRGKSPVEYAEVINHRKLRPNCEKWFEAEELEILKHNGAI